MVAPSRPPRFLTLTARDAELLAELLEGTLSDLRVAIADAGPRPVHAQLRERERLLHRLLDDLTKG